MAYLVIGQMRRDRKFPVEFVFPPVGPRDHGRRMSKLLTLEQAIEAVEKHGDDDQRRVFAAHKENLRKQEERAAERAFVCSMGGEL